MDVKHIYLLISYFVHILFEWFLCIYIFIFSQKMDIYYTLYILLVIVLKLIFKYECIMNYFDKKLLQPSYQ